MSGSVSVLIIREDPKWLQKASEAELRVYLAELDAMPDTPEKVRLTKEFDAECNRRMTEDYESRAGGEWI